MVVGLFDAGGVSNACVTGVLRGKLRERHSSSAGKSVLLLAKNLGYRTCFLTSLKKD